MESLIFEGYKYLVRFINVKREGDELPAAGTDGDEGTLNPWADYKMWWTGGVIVTDKSTEREARASFNTFHRRNVQGGIRDESFEESLLLVRGKSLEGKFVSYKEGRDVITDRVGMIDYLLGEIYSESCRLGSDEILPHVEIPLLEQHILAEKGYAHLEPVVASCK